MKNLLQSLLFISLTLSLAFCQPATESGKRNETIFAKKTLTSIYILPLGDVSPKVLLDIKNGLTQFYKITPIIEDAVPLTTDLLAKSKTRYEANKILSKFKSDKNLLIITEKDIAIKYKKHKSDEWGIMGLGYRPGKTCVVSTYRIKRNADEALFKERLTKICIHEIGHNLGLDHCKADPTCLMNDANGTISQVDREGMFFCKKCSKQVENLYKH